MEKGGVSAKAPPKNSKNAKKRSKKRKQARKKAQTMTAPGPASNPLATATLTEGGGMDFATLLVYSCENSCEQSGEEFAVVHEPL